MFSVQREENNPQGLKKQQKTGISFLLAFEQL